MTSTSDGVAAVTRPVAEWERGAWCLAALALTIRDQGEPVGTAAADVLAAAGLSPDLLAAVPLTPAQLGGLGAAPLLKTAALVSGQVDTWGEHDDETLRAQGQGSGAAAVMFEQMMLPQFPELAARLATDGARMLDVGTGIGALGISFARTFPNLHVTGLDVLPRALQLAAETISQAGLQDRMEVRSQDVSALDEPETFDLAWIPAPFVPEPAFSAGVSRMAAALRPGGMLMTSGTASSGRTLSTTHSRAFRPSPTEAQQSTTPEPRRCSSRAAFVMLDRSRLHRGLPASRSHSNSRRSGSDRFRSALQPCQRARRAGERCSAKVVTT